MTFRNVSDLAPAFLLLKEILYFLVSLLQSIYSKCKCIAVLSGQSLFLSCTSENWDGVESWNVCFLLDSFIQLQNINLELNKKRVSFSPFCTIQPFAYKFTVMRCWGFGGLVWLFFYGKSWKDFFLMPLFQESSILAHFSHEQNASLTMVSFFCTGEWI